MSPNLRSDFFARCVRVRRSLAYDAIWLEGAMKEALGLRIRRRARIWSCCPGRAKPRVALLLTIASKV